MEIIKALAISTPVIFASVVLVVAFAFKLSKEKGAMLSFAGAIGLCVMSILNPVVYTGVMPIVRQGMEPENIATIYMMVRLVMNLGFAVTTALIAAGTFMRKPGEQISHSNF